MNRATDPLSHKPKIGGIDQNPAYAVDDVLDLGVVTGAAPHACERDHRQSIGKRMIHGKTCRTWHDHEISAEKMWRNVRLSVQRAREVNRPSQIGTSER